MADQLSPKFSLKKCPPASSHTLPNEPAFGDCARRKPVSVDFEANGEVSSTGWSFEDYSRGHMFQKPLGACRRLETPRWAVNAAELRTLLVRFFELRAGIRTPGTGSLVQRLNAAQRVLLASIPRKIGVLDRLCREYVAVKSVDPTRAKTLQCQIKNLDSYIRLIRMGPGAVARIIHLYYSCGYDSVSVGAEIACLPITVRQTLHRLRRLAERIEWENGFLRGESAVPPEK